jgi:ADP-ribosylglycohydrolase
MLGSIAGDVIGSVYEHNNYKGTDFPFFKPGSDLTDDSILTIATAEVLLKGDGDYASAYRNWYQEYPNAGFGGNFHCWGSDEKMGPYNSWGNGSAMRAGPIGWAFETLDEVLAEAERSASVTHNHPEGVKGAKSAAGGVFLARKGKSKEEVIQWATTTFGYDISVPLDEIREGYKFDVSCQGTMPWAFRAVLEGTDFESTIRLAISIGGDSDTLACIAGAIAEALYDGVPEEIVKEVTPKFDPGIVKIVDAFREKYVTI